MPDDGLGRIITHEQLAPWPKGTNEVFSLHLFLPKFLTLVLYLKRVRIVKDSGTLVLLMDGLT